MTERTYTESEIRPMLLEVAKEAVRMVKAEPPVRTAYTIAGAAKFLGVSARTVTRMNLPRNAAGRIPYEALAEAKASR